MEINFIFFQGKGGGLLQGAAGKRGLPLYEVTAGLTRLWPHFQPAAALLASGPVLVSFHLTERHHDNNTLIFRLCTRIAFLLAGTGGVLVHQPLQPGAMEGLEGPAGPGAVHRGNLGERGMFTSEVVPFHRCFPVSKSPLMVGGAHPTLLPPRR